MFINIPLCSMKSHNFLEVCCLFTLSTKKINLCLYALLSVRYQQKIISPTVSSSSPSDAKTFFSCKSTFINYITNILKYRFWREISPEYDVWNLNKRRPCVILPYHVLTILMNKHSCRCTVCKKSIEKKRNFSSQLTRIFWGHMVLEV